MIRHGAHAIGLPVHTGEDISLSAEERRQVARVAVEAAAIIKVGYPAAIKAAMEIMGRPAGPTRKPIPPLDAAAMIRLRAGLEKLGALAEEPRGW